MSGTNRIARNASSLLASQVATWILTFSLTIVQARYLGARSLGMLSIANSLWAIAGVFIGLGFDALLMKTIARDPGRTSELVGSAMLLRAGLFVIVYALVVGYARLAGYSHDTTIVICIVGISTLIWQCIAAMQAALTGLEQLQYTTIANIAGKAVNTVVAVALLLTGHSVFAVACVMSLAAVVTFSIEVFHLNRIHPIQLRFHADRAKMLLQGGAPYLISTLASTAYHQADNIVISWLVDERALGWYGASQQLYATLLFVPTIMMTAVFPELARLAGTDRDGLFRTIRRSFDVLLLVGVPIGFGTFIVASPLVVLMYGPNFANSGPILTLMGLVLVLMYQNILIGAFLTATDRQLTLTIIISAAAISTGIIDVITVPWCQRYFGNGALGGAVSFLIVESVMLSAGLRFLPKGALVRHNAVLAGKVVLAGLVMIAATWWSRPYFIGIPILIGAVTYPASLWALNAVSEEDRRWLVATAQGAIRRRRGTA